MCNVSYKPTLVAKTEYRLRFMFESYPKLITGAYARYISCSAVYSREHHSWLTQALLDIALIIRMVPPVPLRNWVAMRSHVMGRCICDYLLNDCLGWASFLTSNHNRPNNEGTARQSEVVSIY